MSLRSLITNRASDNLDELKKNLNPLYYGGYVNRKIIAPLEKVQLKAQKKAKQPVNLTPTQKKALTDVGYVSQKWAEGAAETLPVVGRKFIAPAMSDPNSFFNKELMSGMPLPTQPATKAGQVFGEIANIAPAAIVTGKGLPQKAAFSKGALSKLPVPAQVLLSKGVPTAAVGGTLNKAFGGSLYEGAKAGLKSTPVISAIGQYTNPVIEKVTGGAYRNVTNPLTRQVVSRGTTGLLNVLEGVPMDIGLGQKTTKESMALDFLSGVILSTPANKELKLNLKLALKNMDEVQFNKVIKEAKQQGVVVNENAVKQVRNYIKDTTEQIKASPELGGIRPKEYITKAGKNIPESKQMEVLSRTGRGFSPVPEVPQKLPQLSQEPQMQYKDTTQSYEDIIAQNKKMIGSTIEKPTKSVKETLDTLYTQWVDRYEPITRASKVAKTELKAKGGQLRPEYDPEYLVRRLTGAGGIADARYQNELKPIIDTIDDLKIDKSDMDLYLANKRIAGFEAANRKVYGADTAKAKQIVNAIETKYGADIQDIANRLYEYQDKGFQEMVDAGFISPVTAKVIRGQNPDYAPLQRVMDEVDDYLGLPTRKTMQGTQPISKLKGSTRQIESPLENIIANTFKQRAAIEKNRVARSIVDLQKVAPQLGFSKTAKAGDDTITVWNNGKKEFWKVGEEIAETAKGLNEENVNTILKIFRAPASLLRQGATGRNPEFMVPNVIRDQLDAAVASKYGYIPFIDYLSGLKSMLTKDDIYRKWENSGAKIDLGEMSGRKSIQESFDSKTAKKNLFSWVTKGLDVMGKLSEQPTRVGLFKKAYKKTGNEMLAMMESRDATVDFARMGSKMKVANSIIPFLNVQVQGFDKLIRAVKDHPAKIAFLGTVYGALPSLATTIYNIINHPKEYSEIPQYEKDSNFVIVTGRNKDGTVNYITIPKGNIIPVIANPVENFLSYFAGTSPLEFKEFATQFITSTLPVIGEGTSLSEVALKTVGGNLPQLVKPITENLVNKSFYRYDPKKEEAKEIVPFYLKDKEPYKQTYKFTPKMYQTIGAIFNVSPLKVKNLMEGYLAGYAKIPAQIIEMAYKAGNKEEISPNEKTILRRFFKQTYPTSAKASTVSERTTPFLQRITGKVSASEEARMELDEARDEARYSGKPVATKDSIVYPYNDTTRVVKRIITPPELTSNNELNKKIVSDYKSDLTDYGNYIMYLYENKLISEEKAGAELEKVELYKDIISGTTKSGKKAKKVDLAAISQKILKPVKVEVNTPKLNTFDILSGYSKIKAPTIEAPNLEVGVPKFDLPELTLPNFRKEL
jgi:hypothetical protein